MDTKTITIRLPADLVADLDEWREAQRVRPSRNSCVSEAIRQFVTPGAELDRKVGAGLARVVGMVRGQGHSGDFDRWIVEDLETRTCHHVDCDERPHWAHLVTE